MFSTSGQLLCEHPLGTTWGSTPLPLACPSLVHGERYSATCVCTNGAQVQLAAESNVLTADFTPPMCTLATSTPDAVGFNASDGGDPAFDVEYNCVEEQSHVGSAIQRVGWCLGALL